MLELCLIRHGETAWSRSGQHTGRTDIGLTPVGERQAALLGRRLAGRKFALVLTSPLARARETCRLAGCGEVAVPEPDLLEWDYGGYEGRPPGQHRRPGAGGASGGGGAPPARAPPPRGPAGGPARAP